MIARLNAFLKARLPYLFKDELPCHTAMEIGMVGLMILAIGLPLFLAQFFFQGAGDRVGLVEYLGRQPASTAFYAAILAVSIYLFVLGFRMKKASSKPNHASLQGN